MLAEIALFRYIFTMGEKPKDIEQNQTNLSVLNDITVPEELTEKIKVLLDLHGASDSELFSTIGKGLKAKKITIDKYGDEHVEDDNNIIHKYVLLIAELKGYIKRSSSVEVNTNVQVNAIKLLLPDEYKEKLGNINGIEI